MAYRAGQAPMIDHSAEGRLRSTAHDLERMARNLQQQAAALRKEAERMRPRAAAARRGHRAKT